MVSTTSTYNLQIPTVGSDEDAWGGYVNATITAVGNLLDGTTPVTGIDINSGAIDGTPIGANSASTGAFTTVVGTTLNLSTGLAANLSTNGFDIVTTSNADLDLAPGGTGKVVVRGNTNSGKIVLNCEANSHGVTVASPPHSANATYEVALPNALGLTNASAVVTTDANGHATFGGNITITGGLTVNGTQTIINSTTLDVDDLNITVAKGAADAAAANGAGLTVDGASATFNYASSGDKWTMNKPLDVTGAVTATGAIVNGPLDIEEVYEKVTVQTSTTGTITFDTVVQAVELYTANQTANRTINFSNVNSNLAIGQSLTVAIAMTQGSTAYYLNAYQVDGSSVTPKWSGGSAPTAGNASSIDSYSFTIIKTANATFTVLASLTQYA